MSEFKFFMNGDDFLILAQHLVEHYDITFIPATSFRKKDGEKLNRVNQIMEHLEYYRELCGRPALSYFLVSKRWSVEPIYFEYMDSNPNFEPYYYGHQRSGGPSLFLYLGDSIISPTNTLLSSWLGDYSYYISGSFFKNSNDYKTIDRPAEMREDFINIKKFIRKSSKQKVKMYNRIIYFMDNAFNEYENGKELL